LSLRLDKIIYIGNMSKIIENIKKECSDFLSITSVYPALKAFDDHGKYFRKVKVRHKKKPVGFIRIIGDALQKEHRNIHMRSVVVNGPHSEKDGMKTHYIFPKNGFKFLFNPRINDHEEYRYSYTKLLGLDLVDKGKALEMMEDSIEYAYTSDNTSLNDALKSKKEIIFYGMQYYYTVSSEKYPCYNELIRLLQK